MNDTEYHAHPAMGSTTLKTARTKTGRGFWAKCVDPNRKPFLPTDPMRQGSLVDCLETCPDKFDDKYIILPSNAPTKPTKAQLKAEKKPENTGFVPTRNKKVNKQKKDQASVVSNKNLPLATSSVNLFSSLVVVMTTIFK